MCKLSQEMSQSLASGAPLTPASSPWGGPRYLLHEDTDGFYMLFVEEDCVKVSKSCMLPLNTEGDYDIVYDSTAEAYYLQSESLDISVWDTWQQCMHWM